MIRCTERTRRSDKPLHCLACLGRHKRLGLSPPERGAEIKPGERYRELLLIGESDITEGDYARWVAHARCVEGEEMWAVRAADYFSPQSLEHIRGYYRLPWVRMHARVRGDTDGCRGKVGTILGGSGPRLVVRWDGERRHAPYHPRDVAPLEGL